MAKLCAKGKAAAKRKFDVYPSAYANMYASAVCSGKVKPGGKKKTVKKAKGGGLRERVKQKWEDKKPYIQPHDTLPPNLPIWKGNLKGGAYTEGSRPSYPDTVHYNQNLEGIKAIEAIFYNMKYGKDLDLDKFFEREKQIQEEKYIKNEE